jgi:8-amino-7-oxononanoate synthase
MQQASSQCWRSLPFLREALDARSATSQLREPPAAPHARPSFCSNDYLGFANEVHDADPARRDSQTYPTHGVGAGASRLVAGEHAAHQQLETALSEWLGYPGVLTFSSGYAANVGTLAALIGPNDEVYSDALNHASLIDGIRLSRATPIVFNHNDVDDLERHLLRGPTSPSHKPANAAAPNVDDYSDITYTQHPPRQAACNVRRWVIVESYYSMDADTPDLAALRTLCDRHNAYLIVDEAHALGVFGTEGRGLCADAGITPDVFLGTLGKSVGTQGGFVAGAPELRVFLWNFARSFVFSTGISPFVAAAAARNIPKVRAANDRRAHALAMANMLRETMRAAGHSRLLGHGPIVPWIIGQDEDAVAHAKTLREYDFEVGAIRPPTVPKGTARIRFVISGTQDPLALRRLSDHVASMIKADTTGTQLQRSAK